ncbi:MAG: helix-turn-helix domain-containing protein [Patescibacteria group bacterium]|nr:MAG: helix-turn-helix domain-containing protein [Patescibacteria group bacterium]
MKMLARELEKLGLSDKEALVYLASLELGPSPVQVIARKAEVNRATTYVMIEALLQKGLMSTFDKGKKTLYTAEKPERLHRIVHHERAAVDEKELVIKRLLPDLEAISDAAGERPKVSFFEGVEGLEAMRETIFESGANKMEDVISYDDLRHLLPEEHWKKHNKRLDNKKIKGRALFTTESGKENPSDSTGLWEYKKLPHKLFPMHGELTVYGDRVAMIALRGKLVGVIIESKEMATMVRTLFDLAWKQADQYK